MNIIYSPDNPYEIMMDFAFEKAFFPVIFIGMGGVFCLIGLGSVIGIVKGLLFRGIAS